MQLLSQAEPRLFSFSNAQNMFTFSEFIRNVDLKKQRMTLHILAEERSGDDITVIGCSRGPFSTE